MELSRCDRFLMEEMRPRMSFFGVIVCGVIAIQTELVFALSWKNVSTNIISCTQEKVLLPWEYEVDPGEYVKAKTWFTGVNKTAQRIAFWKDTDGLTIEPAYRDRIIKMENNDSLLLSDVKASDKGLYTLITSIPLSSEPDPRLTLNLTVYISPLKEEGCCKPDINASHNELHAFLHTEQGCGDPTPTLIWSITRNKTVNNNKLILGDNDKEETYKVCVMGPAVDECFKGDKEVLCRSYTVHAERAHQTAEIKTHIPVVVWVVIPVVIILLLLAVVMIIIYRRRLHKGRAKLKEAEPFMNMKENVRKRITLLETALDVKSLTKELAHTYQEQLQFQMAESDLKLQTEIYEGSTQEPDIDINIYSKVFFRNEQPLKRILIQGEVGCGKKTWCNTLTHEWCKAHGQRNMNPNQSSGSDNSNNDNINFLQGYQLLFNISLSKVQNFMDLNDLLKYLHISMIDQLAIDINEYIKTYKTIIIIQGLDEYRGNSSNVKNILSDKGLDQAVVIVTSTPQMWSRTYQETSVHRKIHVKGLDKEEMEKRAQKILTADGFPQHSIDAFFTSIRLNGLEDFATDPVFFPFLVKLWNMHYILPHTKADFLLNFLEFQMKGKILSVESNAFRYDFDNNTVFKDKLFIIHYGKIVKFLGQIAFRILRHDRDGIMVQIQDFKNIFTKQSFPDEVSHRSIILFCKGINLVSTAESDEEDDIQNFSFRHKVMVAFLSAIYISTLKEEKRRRANTKAQPLTACIYFLRCVSTNYKD